MKQAGRVMMLMLLSSLLSAELRHAPSMRGPDFATHRAITRRVVDSLLRRFAERLRRSVRLPYASRHRQPAQGVRAVAWRSIDRTPRAVPLLTYLRLPPPVLA